MRELPSQPLPKQRTSSRAAERKRETRLLVLPGWLAMLLMGLLVLFGFVPGTWGAGALCALLGIGGCAWELNYWARIWRKQQRLAQSAKAHAAKKVTRQARQAEQKKQQQQQKANQAYARQNQALQDKTEREAQREHALHTTAQKSAHFAQVTREAERLQSLDTAAFIAEAEGIVTAHDTHSQNGAGTNDIVMRFVEGSVAVADVETLEYARQQANVPRAYIIGRNGFTPAAVRLSQRFPITCVEPQLLAQWKITAETQ